MDSARTCVIYHKHTLLSRPNTLGRGRFDWSHVGIDWRRRRRRRRPCDWLESGTATWRVTAEIKCGRAPIVCALRTLSAGRREAAKLIAREASFAIDQARRALLFAPPKWRKRRPAGHLRAHQLGQGVVDSAHAIRSLGGCLEANEKWSSLKGSLALFSSLLFFSLCDSN